MKAAEFLKNVEGNAGGRLYLICGEENYMRSTATERLLDALPLGMSEMNISRLGAKTPLKKIRDLGEQMPCFGDCRALVLSNLELLESSEGDELKEYLTRANETTRFIFVCEKAPDGRRGVVKYIKKEGCTVEADSLSEEDLLKWLASQARRRKLVMTKEAAESLLKISGTDMGTLLQELDKLAFLEKERVTATDVLDLASRSDEYNAFLFHDLMMEQKVPEAFEILRHITAKKSDYIQFLGLIGSKFSPMLLAKQALNSGMGNRSAEDLLVSKCGLKSYPAKLAVKDAMKFSLKQIKRSVRLLEQEDVAEKSGGKETGAERLMLEIYGIC